jgi:flagellar basal body-associated protein FliL
VVHIAAASEACVQTAANLDLSQPSEDFKMSLETILIIVLIVFLLGGGGWYWRGRG